MSDTGSPEQDLLSLIEKGISNSAAKLASISKTEWTTQTVSIKTTPLSDLKSSVIKDEKEHYGAYFTMPGGVFLAMFPTKSGGAFADAFLSACVGRPDGIKDREQTVMAEISNIVVNTVATTIANSCDMAFFLSAPKLSKGSKKDLLEAAPAMISPPGGKYMVMAYVHLSSAEMSSDCTIILLLSAAWKQRIIDALS